VISVWRILRKQIKSENLWANVLLTTFRRLRRSSYWMKECSKSTFWLRRLRWRIHVLARNDVVDDVFVSFASRNSFQKTRRSRTWRFHFNVKLFLLDNIYIQNIFSIFFAYVASKALSYIARDIKWSRRKINKSFSSLLIINVFLQEYID
jgi:hypothetical protein